MTYTLQQFKEMGIYVERPVGEAVKLSGGKKTINLPTRIKKMLNETGGGKFKDASRQDSAVITSMLNHGLSPEDVLATFMSSPRGKDVKERKQGHVEDYMRRTISKAKGFLNKAPTNGHIKHEDDNELPTSNNVLRVDFGRTRKVPEGEGIITTKAIDVQVETPQWLWPGYIPLGKITIIAGDPGMGKSTIALDIASRISRGTFMPMGERSVSGTCLIASAEDAAEDTIVPRLVAAKANLERIEIMREVKIEDELCYLSFPRDLEMFRDAIRRRGARIAVIDPLNAFLSRETDSHKDQDIRGVLAPFEHIAQETGAAILIVAHLNKKEESSALYRVGGSIGLIGAARSVIAVSALAEKGTRVLYSLKSNLAKTPPSIEYKTRSTLKVRRTSKDKWKGEERIVSSSILWVGHVDFDPNLKEVIDKDSAEDRAEEFLRQVIHDHEVNTDEIFKEARKAGLSRGQLMRLKDSIGIKVVRKRDGSWYWKWPDDN